MKYTAEEVKVLAQNWIHDPALGYKKNEQEILDLITDLASGRVRIVDAEVGPVPDAVGEPVAEQGRDEWHDIMSCPDCDDLMWFCKGDTYDGPRMPALDDCDYWTHWCYAKPPSLPMKSPRASQEPQSSDTFHYGGAAGGSMSGAPSQEPAQDDGKGEV